MDDKLELLRVRSQKVLVGERELTLRTSSLVQQQALAAALGKADPTAALAAVSPLLGAAGGEGFAAAVVEAGPALYRALMAFLADSAGPAVAEGVGILLDNEVNFRALRDEGVLGDEECEREGRRYVLSSPLRQLVASTVTPRQAFAVLSGAMALNDYTVLGEALAALVMKAARAATGAAASVQPATASSPELTAT